MISKEDFERYVKNPLDDQWFRDKYDISENRYYTVSMWPNPGDLRINTSIHREVKAKKISKSDQKVK